MCRLFPAFAVAALIAGCAGTQPRPSALVAGSASFSDRPARVPVLSKTIELKKLDNKNQTVCEEIRRPDSRIVTGKRCYTLDPNDPEQKAQQETARFALQELRLRQEAYERWLRQQQMEQQRERERQQELMRQALRGGR